MKVNIDDKISKIKNYQAVGTESKSVDGFLSTNGKIIDKDDEVTFRRFFVHNEQVFSISCKEDSMPEPMIWQRFERLEKHDYRYLDMNYPEAVVFIPKRDIWFFGLCVWSNYSGKDMGI